ncbi:MAG: hypothetical protein EON58_00570 [Alphaproteobacteria bacterium]|nr:MAG: hypothetical protein EON58_00570 [Alphaproteobacteria bacterium]
MTHIPNAVAIAKDELCNLACEIDPVTVPVCLCFDIVRDTERLSNSFSQALRQVTIAIKRR